MKDDRLAHREVQDQPVDGVPLRMTRPSCGRNKKEAMWKQNNVGLSNRAAIMNYPVAQLPYQMNPRALHRLEGIPNFDDESRSFLEGCALTELQLVHIANRFQELLKEGLPNPSAWLIAFAGSFKRENNLTLLRSLKASNFQMDEMNRSSSTETPQIAVRDNADVESLACRLQQTEQHMQQTTNDWNTAFHNLLQKLQHTEQQLAAATLAQHEAEAAQQQAEERATQAVHSAVASRREAEEQVRSLVI